MRTEILVWKSPSKPGWLTDVCGQCGVADAAGSAEQEVAEHYSNVGFEVAVL